MPDSASEVICVQPVVIVSALTYKRPKAVVELLRGLGGLKCPAGWDVRFLIVDNDPEGSARELVEAAMPGFRGRLSYAVEAEPGIPAARNNAVRAAIAAGAELLCFIDDDELPDERWLAELIACRTATGAVLVGGPQRRTFPEVALTWKQRLIASSLAARRSIMERRCARLARKGGVAMIGTSNWLVDVDWVRRNNLRFDPAFRSTGGEDAAFMQQVRKRGGMLAWAPTAIVYEAMEPSRLNLRYQFERSYAQGHVAARLEPLPLRVLASEAAKAASGALLFLVPVLGVASPAIGLHLIAFAAGRTGRLPRVGTTPYAPKVQEDVLQLP